MEIRKTFESLTKLSREYWCFANLWGTEKSNRNRKSLQTCLWSDSSTCPQTQTSFRDTLRSARSKRPHIPTQILSLQSCGQSRPTWFFCNVISSFLWLFWGMNVHSFQGSWDFDGFSKNYRKFLKVSKFSRLGYRQVLRIGRAHRKLLVPAFETIPTSQQEFSSQ